MIGLIDEGLVPAPLFEGDNTSRLEIIKDIPRGKAVYRFERVDIYKANELLFTCDRISAGEALRIGLVDKMVPHERLMPAALEIAEKIMKSPPLSIKHTKRALRTKLVNDSHKSALEEGMCWIMAREKGRD